MLSADTAVQTAPWAATALGIIAAVAAEQSFRFSGKGSTPDRWRDDDSFFSDFDHDKEINERSARDCARESAATWQAAATYLAAGAAIEATAASQYGEVAVALTAVGLCSLVPAVIRFLIARRSMAYTNAWYVRLQWSLPRKYVRHEDPESEDEAFALDHPREARILLRR